MCFLPKPLHSFLGVGTRLGKIDGGPGEFLPPAFLQAAAEGRAFIRSMSPLTAVSARLIPRCSDIA